MALHAQRRLLCFMTALLFAISSVGQVYAATEALMQMPVAAMEDFPSDHGMDCGGKDKASRAACVALCATSVAILADPVAVPFAVAQRDVEADTESPPPGRGPLPEPHPPKR
jgi:hypothetical protein